MNLQLLKNFLVLVLIATTQFLAGNQVKCQKSFARDRLGFDIKVVRNFRNDISNPAAISPHIQQQLYNSKDALDILNLSRFLHSPSYNAHLDVAGLAWTKQLERIAEGAAQDFFEVIHGYEKIVEGYYVTYFRFAMTSERDSVDLQSTFPLEKKLRSLVLGHPRLMNMMVENAMEFTQTTRGSQDIHDYYESFFRDLEMTSLGNLSKLHEQLYNSAKISLVRVSMENQEDNDQSGIDNLLWYGSIWPSYVAYRMLESIDPTSYLLAVNPPCHRYFLTCPKGVTLVMDHLVQPDAHELGEFVTSMAKRSDILLNLSDRWPSFDDDKEFLNTIEFKNSDLKRKFYLKFFSPEIAGLWLAPGSVTIVDRDAYGVTVELNDATQVILLDTDLRIEKVTRI